MDGSSPSVLDNTIHIPLKCSLPCDSRSQVHRFRIENPDTQSFFRQADCVERDLDLLLSRSQRHIDSTITIMNRQTERMRQMIFGQMVTAINQNVEASRLQAQQSKTLSSRKRAADMTAAECQQYAQNKTDLFKLQTNPEEFIRRITKRISPYVHQLTTAKDVEARSLANCRTRLDKIDLQFMGPCPRNGSSDIEVKREMRELFDSL